MTLLDFIDKHPFLTCVLLYLMVWGIVNTALALRGQKSDDQES